MRLNSRQTVSEFVPEHAAKQGTPTMGGLIVAFGMLVGLLFFIAHGGPYAAQLLPYLVLLVGFAAIGFVDDFVIPRVMKGKRGLGWKQKFALQILFVAGAMMLYPGVTWQIGLVAGFSILFFANAYNFTDGMDGMAGGVGIFLLIGLAALNKGHLESGPDEVLLVAVLAIAGLIPFLWLNAPPAKIFMGDVGSLPIGAWIGLIVYRLTTAPKLGPLAIPPLALALISVVMVLELVPVPIQIASVKLFKRKVFSFTPIHHAFQKKGIPETRVAWGFILAQLVLSLAAITAQAAFSNVG